MFFIHSASQFGFHINLVKNDDENKLTTSEYCCEYIFRFSDALLKHSELFFSSLIPRPILSFWCLLLLAYQNLIIMSEILSDFIICWLSIRQGYLKSDYVT